MTRNVRWPAAVVILVIGFAMGVFFSSPVAQSQNSPPATAPRDLTSYRDVVKRVLPAVVSIEAKAQPRRPTPPRTRTELFERNPSPADGDLGFGSGMIIDRSGVVVTNYHVVEDAEWVEVRLTDGRKFNSRDIRTDKLTDMAIIRIHSKEPLPYLEFGDSDAMEMGDRVLAFGAPFGLTGSVTSGIVSAKGRNLHLNKYDDFIQTDAAINPGNSGGPLVSLDGKVIGITSAIKSRNGAFQGVGLAIASNMAKVIVVQLLRDGVVHRGYVGLKFEELSSSGRTKLGVAGGVVVTVVFPKAPAATAGLKVGDVIIAVGGKAIKDGTDLEKTIAAWPLGQEAEITFIRDGKFYKIKLTIVDQPPDFG